MSMIQTEETRSVGQGCAICGATTMCPSWCNGKPIGNWIALGACSDADPEIFFPEGSFGRGGVQLTIEAKRICNGCPVRTECLEYALEAEIDHGLWGGMTPSDRRYRRNELLQTLKKRRANEKRLEETR